MAGLASIVSPVRDSVHGMKSLDDVIRKLPPGGTIVVRAEMLGLSARAFQDLAREIQADGGADDCDFVKAHRLGETSWAPLEKSLEDSGLPVDAITLRRHRN